MTQYRPDIDGLRTLAVLPVLFFHAGIPGFGGGYVGVDVFFVISGFLITSILLKDLAGEKFSLAVFYERRARRILPALTAVILFCFGVSLWLGIPSVMHGLSRSILWLSLGSSNLFFKSEYGYFDADSTTKPLLHTWSLSVEEQFYIIFPLLLFLGWKYARKQLGTALCLLMLISLLASFWGLRRDPSAAFYYLHFRAWELGLGCLLAFAYQPQIRFSLPQLNRWSSETLSILGIAGVVVPVFLYSHQTPFPGLAALPPCLGTFLLIWTNTDRLTLVGRVLAIKPVVGIGLISYSLYLWHWPLLVFGTLRKGEPLTPGEGLIILGFTYAAAWLSVRLIEKPFREKRFLGPRKQLLAASAVVLLLSATLGWGVSRSSLLYGEQTASQLLASPRGAACDFGQATVLEIDRGVQIFSFGNQQKSGVLMIGDSFANHWINGLVKWGQENELPVHLQAMASVLPLLESHVPEAEIKYQLPGMLRNSSYGKILDRVDVKHVILAASWKIYINPKDKLHEMNTLVIGDKTPKDMTEQRQLMSQQLERTIHYFNARGCKVWLMLPPPDYPFNVPLKLAALVRNQTPISASFMQEHLAEERRRITRDFLQDVAAKFPATEAEILDPLKFFSRDGYCVTAENDRSLYIDESHLSYDGSLQGKQVFQTIAQDIAKQNSVPLTAGKSANTK